MGRTDWETCRGCGAAREDESGRCRPCGLPLQGALRVWIAVIHDLIVLHRRAFMGERTVVVDRCPFCGVYVSNERPARVPWCEHFVAREAAGGDLVLLEGREGFQLMRILLPALDEIPTNRVGIDAVVAATYMAGQGSLVRLLMNAAAPDRVSGVKLGGETDWFVLDGVRTGQRIRAAVDQITELRWPTHQKP